MQQTTKYQFNLVDATDDFSPAPLNQNMEKVEEELDSLTSALTQGLGGLEDSLDAGLAAVNTALGTGGSNCRIAWGSYVGSNVYGSGNRNTLNFDFRPVAVILGCDEFSNSASSPGVFLRPMGRGHSEQSTTSNALTLNWLDKGVQWYSTLNALHQMNDSRTFYYVVIGYDAEA